MVWTQRRSEGGGSDQPKGLVAHFNAVDKGFKVSRFQTNCLLKLGYNTVKILSYI